MINLRLLKRKAFRVLYDGLCLYGAPPNSVSVTDCDTSDLETGTERRIALPHTRQSILCSDCMTLKRQLKYCLLEVLEEDSMLRYEACISRIVVTW